ncbi:MAG: hypothetical protein JWO30_674 [Fibrobacteres bacterium]|nr:hypothetical protein [Fibrobacterota bacterium]
MEDVLLNYLQARKQAQSVPGNSEAAGEPVSWTKTGDTSKQSGPEADAFLKPSLPYPLNGLFTLVESHREYPASCRELAEFLKKLCGQHPLEDALLQVLQARFPRVWMERFLFILLEVQPSDSQTAAYALQFRHLKRLLLRVERKTPLNAVESGLARELISALSLSRFLDFDPFCRHAAAAFKTMQAGCMPVSGDLGLLIYLIRCECTAMGERKNWLETNLGSGDPDTVARLSPHLKLLEERMIKAQEMAQRIGSYGPLQEAPMGLEEAMGPFFFAHLKECLAKSPSLAGLKEALDLQQAKRVPTRDLIALSSLSRWLMEARGAPAGPLEWVRMALESYDRGHFRLDVAGGLPAVEVLLSEAKVEREGTLVLGNFGENPYSPWIARDGLTRPYRSSNPDRIAPDLRSTVLANIHRDSIIMKLLDNPKVQETPGLIETIVEGSRSSLVHSKIATRRELHSGSVNGRVPVALVRSPVTISTSLIRSLLNPSVISFTEMKSLYRGRSALRHEVAEELHSFLKQAHVI